MANLDAARGFKLINSLSGVNPQIRKYFIPSTDETATFVGDAVKSAGGADGDGIGTVAQCVEADPILGIVVGFDKVKGIADADFNLYQTHRPADVGMYALVCDDPNATYEIQADDDTNILAAVDIGLNADYIVGAGNAITGISAMELDSSTKNTSATLPLKIVNIIQRPDNEAFSANQQVLVKINNAQYGSHTGTAGV